MKTCTNSTTDTIEKIHMDNFFVFIIDYEQVYVILDFYA